MSWLKTRIKTYIDYAIERAVKRTVSELEPTSSITKIIEEDYGHGRTLREKLAVAADGSPLPWFTYPAIEYFSQLDARNLCVFEFGCGNSSLFWSHRGAEVWSVEHDSKWFERMQKQSASLCELMLREEPSEYIDAIRQTGKQFDIIVIDGVWRNECAAAVLPYLKKGGIIVLDNSDWYMDVAIYLRKQGFFQVDFNGFGPIVNFATTTSIFIQTSTTISEHMNYPHPIGGIESYKSKLR